jgi:hypothetical protein
MNFYATREYLGVISEVYFKGRRVGIEDVRIGDDVLRLLVVGGRRVVTSARFLDYHEPIGKAEAARATRSHAYSNFVVRGVVEPSRWEECRRDGFELAPYVDWSMFPTFDRYKDFIAGRNRGLVRECERRGRRLAEQLGPIAFAMNDEGDDALALARVWKKRQLRKSGEVDYFADPRTMECLELLRRRGLLTTSTLRAGGRLASVYIGFVHDGVWGGWIFAYDPELQKYSCGHQLMTAMLEHSHRLGHRQFDLSIGSEPYKTVYATHARVLGTIGRPPVRQQVIGRLKRELRGQAPRLFDAAKAVKRQLLRQKSIYESWLRGTEVLTEKA